eukprot:UN03999
MYLAHGDDGFGGLTRRDPELGLREAGELLLLLCSHEFWFYVTHRMNLHRVLLLHHPTATTTRTSGTCTWSTTPTSTSGSCSRRGCSVSCSRCSSSRCTCSLTWRRWAGSSRTRARSTRRTSVRPTFNVVHHT